ncbi:Hint domain-containing protein [Shimia sagamensis]|uniref:Hint domain-containing protein n=1 Tax=Shimia sagamensis TaxID=1566352 RepID=A0ABY1PLB0_9RHOB|nr:Hint domain-containing protein [Shimia sagamensis]SMP36371.1 Hint domain-containing protein [Shimia sagamensis]
MKRPGLGTFNKFLESRSPGDRGDSYRRFPNNNSENQETSVAETEKTDGENAEHSDTQRGGQPNPIDRGPPYEIDRPEDDRGPQEIDRGPPYKVDPPDDDRGPPEIDRGPGYDILPPEDDVAPPEIDRGPPYEIDPPENGGHAPCFTPGTLISTPQGHRLVEELKPGDEVLTRDRGVRKICWVGRRDLKREDLERNPALCPILVRRGALDHCLPHQDLLVSPNHRFLSLSAQTVLLFGELEVLVAAKFLPVLDGVEQVQPQDVSYIHFMFDKHELVLSHGVWTESFQPSDHSLSGMDEDQRQEILSLFPSLADEQGPEKNRFVAARPSLKKFESVALLHMAGSFC